MSLQEALGAEMDFRALAALARRGFGWWTDELAELLPRTLRERFSRRPRTRVEPTDGGGWRYFRDGRQLGEHESQAARTAEIALMLPADALLVREITLPRMSESDTRRVLALDIDRLSPLPADLIHAEFEVIDRDAPGGGQTVRLAIVTRVRADAALAAARAAGLVVGALVGGPTGDGQRSRLDFLPSVRAAAGQMGRSRGGRWPWACVAALLALNLAALVGRDMADVAGLGRMVDAQRPAVDAALMVRRRVEVEDARRRAMLSRGQATEPLRMLNAVTEAVPLKAWVQRLEWNGQTLRVAGFRTADLDMAAAIRGSGMFTNPRSLGAEVATRALVGQPFDITAASTKRRSP